MNVPEQKRITVRQQNFINSLDLMVQEFERLLTDEKETLETLLETAVGYDIIDEEIVFQLVELLVNLVKGLNQLVGILRGIEEKLGGETPPPHIYIKPAEDIIHHKKI